ncbi:MAG: hypothetical protein NTU95_09535 [Methanothrix sp.]|nr:hypothetical protein [Methanothrix sp.]
MGFIWLKSWDGRLFLRVVEKSAGVVRTRITIREVVRVFLVERRSKEIAKIKAVTPVSPNVPRSGVNPR